MTLDPRISSLKAAGTYRFEFDKSQTVALPTNQTRLFVGFSKKGEFNTPVYIPNASYFKEVFGDIDRSLERKNSFFHRSCLTGLERGPIIALNLLSLDADDKVDSITLSTGASYANSAIKEIEFRKIYNTDKFFYPDTENFLTQQKLLSGDDGLLSFVNIKQQPISIIVKKAATNATTNLNVTVEEWYGSAEVPSYLNKASLISDYMVDVYVIGGEWGKINNSYERFTSDPIFQKYFDKDLGVKRNNPNSTQKDVVLSDFLNQKEVNVIASFTGSLIPDFTDLLGNNIFIENIINKASRTTGLFCAVNKDAFDDEMLDGGKLDLIGHGVSTGGYNFLSYTGTQTEEAIDIIADLELKPNQFKVDGGVNVINVGDFIKGLNGLTRVLSVQNVDDILLVECQSEVEVLLDAIVKVQSIDDSCEYLNLFTLKGFKLNANKHIPDGTNERQNSILSQIRGTNLAKALIDKETISFRYLIDTFGAGIEANSKSVYTELCQQRKNAFALINAPSAKNFKDSTNPIFTNRTGGLDVRLISTGGDLSLNPTTRFSLPSQAQGASWGAYFFPYVTVRDLGKNINVPPAAYVSNNFINKFDNALPWSLVAGVRRGVVSGAGVVGLEINLDNDDRNWLEPFGINSIIQQAGVGPVIFSNKTAQQTPQSAVSSINVRESIIYIQDGLDSILKNYVFELNTQQTRLEIKTLADNFLEHVQNDGGVYDYVNVMDESNNTPDVIDANIGILDSKIEPVKGMEILVQRTTILRTGAIASGNF